MTAWNLIVTEYLDHDAEPVVTRLPSREDAFTALLTLLANLGGAWAEEGFTDGQPTCFRGMEHRVQIVPADVPCEVVSHHD
jgi:hypothetical protein